MSIEYMLVFEWGLDKFEREIAKAIKDGWIPQGGVSMVWDSTDRGDQQLGIAQAVIRTASNQSSEPRP